MAAQIEPPDFRIEEIQYLPDHRCPQCGAPPRTTETGAWLRPYEDWFGTPLRYWQDHLAYVYFRCDCQHHAGLQAALRVARLGEAILPVPFLDACQAARQGLHPAWANAEITKQAVAFLAAHADPVRSNGSEWLAHTLAALAAGGLSPEAARREIQAWAAQAVEAATQVRIPVSELAGLALGK